MTSETAEPTGRKQSGRRFQKGQSGNPAGRPPGSRNAVLRALDAIGAENAEAIINALIEKALAGDVTALKAVADRVWPMRKGTPVAIDLPVIETGADLLKAQACIVNAIGAGEISPDEGAELSKVLDAVGTAFERRDLETRIAALEAKGTAK